MMDITKPLKRFQMIRVKGDNTVKVSFKYERLPQFCFLCGLMNHTDKDCSYVVDEDEGIEYGWGLDLRTSPCKGFSKYKEEIDALKLRKCLFVFKPTSSSGSTVLNQSSLKPPDVFVVSKEATGSKCMWIMGLEMWVI